MKRAGQLIPLIAEPENLREAFLLAVKGKQLKRECVLFREQLDVELTLLSKELLEGSYSPGEYRRFRVFDPKERIICAAPFRDRVAQHAMMRVCHHLFERYQTNSSYASRPGRGTYKALEQAQRYSRQYAWWLKLDVVKFFDSISHECLIRQLQRLVKDPVLLAYWKALIEGYSVTEGRGLPIGNLCSQYWANHYLATADHWVMEKLHLRPMVRYMDDMVLWGNDRQQLLRLAEYYRQHLEKELRLALHPIVMNHVNRGMPFLGYVVYPWGLRLNQRSRHRFRRKTQLLERLADEGVISQEHCLMSTESMLAFVEKCHQRTLPWGLQPGESWWQLEQQR